MKKGNNTDKDGVCTSETTTVEGRHQEQNCFIDEEVNGTTINKKKTVVVSSPGDVSFGN